MVACYAICFLLVYVVRVVVSGSLNIVYLIDMSRANGSMAQHTADEKFRLLKNVTRCLLARGLGTNIAAVAYDDKDAKLGFYFKNVHDVMLDNMMEKMMFKNIRRKRSNVKTVTGINRAFISFNFPSGDHSAQTKAFLTVAELVMAAVNKEKAEERHDENENSTFKVLVLSDSPSFAVSKEVRDHFMNSGIEITAIDLSSGGSLELQAMVSDPLSGHYFHRPRLTDEETVENVCERLLKAPADVAPTKSDEQVSISDVKLTPGEDPVKNILTYTMPLRSEELHHDVDKPVKTDIAEQKISPRLEQVDDDDEDELNGDNDDELNGHNDEGQTYADEDMQVSLKLPDQPVSIPDKKPPSDEDEAVTNYSPYKMPLTAEELYERMDKSIETKSDEYKWKPLPGEDDNEDNDEGESYTEEDRQEICRYLHSECAVYAKNGMCSGNPEMRGIKRLCMKSCNYCG